MPGSNPGKPDYECFQDIRQSSHANAGAVAQIFHDLSHIFCTSSPPWRILVKAAQF